MSYHSISCGTNPRSATPNRQNTPNLPTKNLPAKDC